MPDALNVGYGNPLRGDDGLGWHAAERLRTVIQNAGVEILAVHQLAPELMETLSRAGRAIFRDAAVGRVPGEMVVGQVLACPSAVFTHHATPAALLAGAKALYGHAPEATLITVTGADFSVSEGLSPVVRDRLDDIVLSALRLLEQHATLPGGPGPDREARR
jgi:hydrogenase maturation protease